MASHLDNTDQSPAARLLDMLDRIDDLQHAVEVALFHDSPLDHLQEQVLKVQASLVAWPKTVPLHWLPRATQIKAKKIVEHYESMSVAVVYNHWRCACLQVFRLHRTLFPPALAAPLDMASSTLDAIFRAIPIFLGLLNGCSFVEQDDTTSAWKAMPVAGFEDGRQRFRGDYLGKWFLSDLLARVQRAIGSDEDLHKLDVPQTQRRFLQEQKRMLAGLPYQARPQQFKRVMEGTLV